MAQITAAMVKQLREMTDSPMMECKKALVEADGDIEKAVDVLRKMGMAKAVKKAGRETNEGTVAAYVSECGNVAALVEVTCETDFVGGNPKFTGFAKNVAAVVAKANPADVDALKAAEFSTNETVDAALTEMIHTMGENMKIARFARREVENGAFGSYVVTDSEMSFQPTPKVQVADTVGAGDSFTGAFCAAILAGKPIPEAHKIGVDVSAYVCTQQGAMPPYPQELKERVSLLDF